MKLGNTSLTAWGIEVDGKRHPISRQRLRILARLMRARGDCVDHDTLLDVAWDGRDDGPEANIVAVQICYLRKNLSAAGSSIQIGNVHGYGYVARA